MKEKTMRDCKKLIVEIITTAKNRIKDKKCPFCGILIDSQIFKDLKSVKKYHISGLCQQCQDEIFGE